MNMRKIIAVLSAVLMLCAVVPFSVSAAPGDVIIDADFEDGMDGFNNFSVADGALVLDGTSADWANSYAYANNIKPSTTYQVNFRAKADTNKALSFKINNGWSGTNVQASADITTEWQEFELLLTPDSNLTSPIFTIQTGTYATGGTVYYIDYVKVTEYQDPAEIGKVVNGSFEDGTANWKTDSSASLYTADAYEGSNSLKLSNTGYYASAATQTVPVKANTVYELSWKSKRLSGNGAFNVILCQPVSPYTNYTKVAGQNWMNETSGNWVNNSFTINTGDNTSMLIKWTSELSGTAGEILLDDIRLIEVKDPSYDGYIYNGDFEIGKLGFGTGQVSTLGAWYNLWGSTSHELVAGYNSDYALKGTASGGYNITYQNVAVEPNTDYIVCAYSKDSSDSRLWIKNANGNGDITNAAFNSGSDWALTTVKFNSGSNSTVWVGLMGVSAGSTYTVDNVTMFKALPVSNDDYLSNTNFEGGSISGWSVVWSDQVSASIVLGGKDDNFAVYVAGKPDHNYGQLRQTVTVEPNTDYKVTVWAKNSTGMSLLVKHGNDSGNINNVSASAGDEWTLITNEFNSGSNTSVLVGVMEDGNGYGTFDGFLMEKKHVCEFVGEVTEEPTCDLPGTMTYSCSCGEGTYTEEIPAWHDGNLTYVPAVEAIDCANPGHIEYYTCPWCNEYFTDANASEYINPWYINITVDCVRPDGVADCANWTCETCGNENYGYGEHDTGVPACQDGHCSKCDQDVVGYGHQNYDGPACLPGNCYYCGEAMEPVAHENGAWAPCQIGECAYGCGLTYPATADHVDDDADDYCDTCWTHLNHDVDPCVGGECSICWTYIEGAHSYDDIFDTECNVCGETREITAPISEAGFSVSEDVNGLAVRFNATLEGMGINGTTAIYDNATLNGNKVISMGAKVTNGVSTIDVEAKYLCDDDVSAGAQYAIRIKNIPTDKYDVEITFTPYMIVEIDGVETTIYGEAQTGTYNQYAG